MIWGYWFTDSIIDGTPYAVKVARAVWTWTKSGRIVRDEETSEVIFTAALSCGCPVQVSADERVVNLDPSHSGWDIYVDVAKLETQNIESSTGTVVGNRITVPNAPGSSFIVTISESGKASIDYTMNTL